MIKAIIKITAVDMELGDASIAHLSPGQYVVVCAAPMRVISEHAAEDGTITLILSKSEVPR